MAFIQKNYKNTKYLKLLEDLKPNKLLNADFEFNNSSAPKKKSIL